MIPDPFQPPTPAKKHSPRRYRISAVANSPLEASLWLKEAIAMEQTLLRKIMDLSANVQSLPQLLDLVEVTSKAHTRLAGLFKTERQFVGGEDTSAALNQALTEVIQELGLNR